MEDDDIYWEKAKEGYQNKTTSSLVYASEASKASGASSNGTKIGRITWKGGTEGVVTGRVRSLSSQSGQAFVLPKNCGSTATSTHVSKQWSWFYSSMLGSLSCLLMINGGVFFPIKKSIICVQKMGRNYGSRGNRGTVSRVTGDW